MTGWLIHVRCLAAGLRHDGCWQAQAQCVDTCKWSCPQQQGLRKVLHYTSLFDRSFRTSESPGSASPSASKPARSSKKRAGQEIQSLYTSSEPRGQKLQKLVCRYAWDQLISSAESPEGEFQMAEMTRQRGRQDRQVAILKPRAVKAGKAKRFQKPRT